MSRLFIQIILPLIAPAVLYAVWSSFDRRRQGLTGLPGWEEGRWFWAAISGVGLVIFVVLATMLFDRSTDGAYAPARVEDGKIVPGRLKAPESPTPSP